jgi:hypothetical protein
MRARAKWTKALKADPTDWLLEDDNPVVRYWTLRDLVDAPSRRVAVARRGAQESEVATEVLRQQKPRGHWEAPRNMHAPHYTATIYQLSLLGDLGLAAEDERVARGVEAVLQTQRDDGGFPGHNPDRCSYGPYDIGLIVRFMHQFGLGADPRVERMCRWIESHQTSDGGWIGAQGDCRPSPAGCLNAAANVLWGLGAAGGFAGTAVARKGLEFVTQATASLPPGARQFSYPQFWNFWVDDVKLAEIYLGLGVAPEEPPLKRILGKILARQRKDGRWSERRGPYPDNKPNSTRLRRLFPRKAQASKWVTAKAMIALKQALAA